MNAKTPHGRPLRVLEVLGNAIVGGMERYAFNLASHLPADRFEVSFLCPYESDMTAEFRALGCEVLLVEMDNNPPWHSIEATAEIVREWDIDVLHGHLPNAHALVALTGALTGRPAVATLHGMAVHELDLSIHHTAHTYLIAVCRQAYCEALELGVAPDRLALIPNGVDIQRFQPAGYANDFREAAGVPAEAALVGFVGRLSPEKGPGVFLAAAALVREAWPAAHFVFVGGGPLELELRQTATDCGLADAIHFAGIWHNMPQVYPALDVLVLSSHMEGTPMALLEGMACGRAIVATAVGGVPELIVPGISGLLSQPGDWRDIGDNILTLLSDPGLRRRLGAAGRARVERDYKLDRAVAGTARVLKRAVNGRAGLST